MTGVAADETARIRAQVMRGLAGNRQPGFHFPGYFLGVRRTAVSEDAVELRVADGPHIRGACASAHTSVVAFLADVATSTAVRLELAPGVRLATVHLQLQFTGVGATGDLLAVAHRHASTVAGGNEYLSGSVTIRCPSGVVCRGSADFMRLAAPPGVTLAPLPWERPAQHIPDLREDELDERERRVLLLADEALAAPAAEPFIARFWAGASLHATSQVPAQRTLSIGPHVTNRVGHVQGGILIGLAEAAARDVTPSSMRLANLSTWFVRPGRGTTLGARAEMVHTGRTMALVRATVAGDDGSPALEAMTQYVARSP
jgi:acyl-coenzyme A thioesterase PaaI-like protein